MILQTQFVTNYLHDSDQSLDAMHISRSVTLAQWSVKISKFMIITFIAVFQTDIGALAKKSNDNALSLVLKIANE